MRDVLLITAMDGVAHCAHYLEQSLQAEVETATTRRDGLAALRRRRFGVVVVDEGLAEGSPGWADQVWEAAGFAVPLQVNFAVSGSARIGREVKAALTRGEGERKIARASVAAEIENEFRSSLTGLLLQSELALREPSVPAVLAPKLQHVVELAGAIRQQLQARAKA